MGSASSILNNKLNEHHCFNKITCDNFALKNESYCEFCLILSNKCIIDITECVMCFKEQNVILMKCGHYICKRCYDLNCLVLKLSNGQQIKSMYTSCKQCNSEISLKRNSIMK